MSFSIKQFATGIGLKPVSADPSNPTQGQLQYADGTVRAEGLWRYDGTAWQQVGSGAGSYDIFFQENLETNTSSNFTSGQNASPDAAGTGTLGGVLADEESSQLSGDRSLKYTMNATAASSDNDFFLNDTDIALAVKQQGQFIGITFYYTYNGDDDDIRFFVLDQDDNELTQSDEYIKSASTATRFSTSVFVPSDDTALRYGFQVVTGNSSKVFIVDDIEFSTNPFVYKNLTTVDSARMHSANGFGSVNTKIRRYSNIAFADESGSYTFSAIGSSQTSRNGLFTITDSAADGTEITINQKVYVTIGVSVSGPAGFWGGITLNASPTTNITSLPGGDILALDYDSINTGGGSASWSGWLSAGDVIRPHTNGGGDGTAFLNSLSITAAAEAEHVVTPAKAGTEYYRADSPAGFPTGKYNPYFTNERANTISKYGTVTNDSTSGFTFTASKDVVVNVGAWFERTSAGYVGITLNGDLTAALNNAANNGKYIASTYIGANGYTDSMSSSIVMAAGDVLAIHTTNRTSNSLEEHAGITFTVRPKNAEFLAAVPTHLIAILKDEKANTSEGGGFTSGAWQTRDLNTISGDSTFVSLSSNQFTLPAGKYVIEGSAPAYRVSRHRTALYDVTNAAYVEYGENERAFDSDATVTRSRVTATVNISSSTTYELRHRCETTKATDGFGKANSFGVNELFSTVKITKIK